MRLPGVFVSRNMVSEFLRGEVPMSAALVKELRERTGLGLLECKRALASVGGDVALAC